MNGKKDCGFGDEIVSYIYDEMDAADRRKFESHLASCTLCTDEFAGISDARLSIFEWNREDFAELPTPEIVIPYAPKPETASAAGGGWFVSLAEMFAFLKSPATAFAGFAVVAGLGIAIFLGTSTGSDPLVAVNSPVSAVNKLENPKSIDVGKEKPSSAVVPEVEPKNEVIQAKAVERRSKAARSANEIRRSNSAVASQDPVRRPAKAPVLSDLGDDDEDSLRLSDLLDGIGG